jgi:hypothetical protein
VLWRTGEHCPYWASWPGGPVIAAADFLPARYSRAIVPTREYTDRGKCDGKSALSDSQYALVTH